MTRKSRRKHHKSWSQSQSTRRRQRRLERDIEPNGQAPTRDKSGGTTEIEGVEATSETGVGAEIITEQAIVTKGTTNTRSTELPAGSVGPALLREVGMTVTDAATETGEKEMNGTIIKETGDVLAPTRLETRGPDQGKGALSLRLVRSSEAQS